MFICNLITNFTTSIFCSGFLSSYHISSDSMSAKGATELAETNTQSNNALKNRGLSQKKLLSLEAQRISIILENCISQVRIAATLPALLRLNSVSSVVDEELSRVLQEHQILDDRLKQESDGEQEGDVGEARKRVRAQLEKDIKNSVRDLLRLVRAHPDAILGLMAEVGMEVGETEYILIRGLEKFHSYMVEKLLTSVDEELRLALCKPAPPLPVFNLEIVISREEKIARVNKETDAKVGHQVGC